LDFPVNIGQESSTSGGTHSINAIIPLNSTAGTSYHIRIQSTSPSKTAYANNEFFSPGDNFTINAPTIPSLVTAIPSTICAGATSNLNATSAGNTIRWYTTASGGTNIGNQ